MLNVEKLARILDTPWIFSNGALLMGIVIFVILLLSAAVFSKMDERAEGRDDDNITTRYDFSVIHWMVHRKN